jgi:1-acyl-sn-glycerol-3-phosphate acyltransferase
VVVRAFACLFTLLGLRLDVRGLEHVPRTGAAVLAINHTSYLDFAVVGYAASRGRRRVRFLTRTATFDSPVSDAASAVRAPRARERSTRRHELVRRRVRAHRRTP